MSWTGSISPLTIDADDQVPYRHLLSCVMSFVFVCYLCVIVLLDCFFQVLLSVVSRYNLERIVFVVSVAVVKTVVIIIGLCLISIVYKYKLSRPHLQHANHD